jgi:2-methylcitrate dehydratase PrpD
MSVTSSLAAEVITTRTEDIPDSVMDAVKAMTIDHMGLPFMGRRYTGDALCAFAKDTLGQGEAVLLGEHIRVSPGLAAGINAQMTQNSGMESTGPGLHPGPLLVHTAFAAAQKNKVSGANMLAAIAIGYDLNARFHLSRTIDEDVRHLNCVAAAVACRVFGYSETTTARAMSVAWEIPLRSLRYLKPKVVKRISPFPMGHLFAAQAGFQAASLAHNGLDAVPDEIDTLGDEYDLDGLLNTSRRFHFAEDGLFLKKWPSSNLCHMVLQSVTEIVERENIRPRDIETLKVGLPDLYTIPHQTDPAPDSYWQGIYSAPWAISMATHGIEPGPDWFTTERFSDPSARALAAKVEIVEHPPASKALAAKDFLGVEGWVELKTSKGTFKETKTMAETDGAPTSPLPLDQLEDKFKRLVLPDLGEGQTERALIALNSLEACEDVNKIAAALLCP